MSRQKRVQNSGIDVHILVLAQVTDYAETACEFNVMAIDHADIKAEIYTIFIYEFIYTYFIRSR